jgi:hypothetical protein
MRKKRHLIGAILLVILFLQNGQSQERRFTAGLILGMNASQVDGDLLAGFNKIGLTAGARGSAIINDKLDFNLEFLFSQRGSRPDIFNALLDPDINISLQYAEIPIYIGFYDWKVDDYYKVKVHGGLSYGRLIKASTVDAFQDDPLDLELLADSFNNNDLSWIIGGSIFFTKNVGITVRYTRFINKLLNPSKLGINAPALRSYFLTFRADYNF